MWCIGSIFSGAVGCSRSFRKRLGLLNQDGQDREE
jgi:hypothetical protein